MRTGMNIDLLFQIAGIGMLVAIISQVLKRAGHEDMAVLSSVAGLIVVLLIIVNLLSQLFNSVKSIFQLY